MRVPWNLAVFAALTIATASISLAQTNSGTEAHKMPAPHGKMQHTHRLISSKSVYTCAQCKMYYTPAQAKKMHYKDAMGHKLSRKTKAPAGYKMASSGMIHGEDKRQGKGQEKTADKQASAMKCPVCKTMEMTSTKTADNTQEVKIKGKTWYCCSGCDMSAVADK